MEKFIAQYLESIGDIIKNLDLKNIGEVIKEIKKAYKEDKRIFVFGNGGSAATANHFACDFGKNAIKDENKRIKIISLSSSISSITAYGNDVGFDSIFEEQLKNLMHDGDLTICISASGNSPNILKAAEYAKKRNGTVISLTGFDGGKLKESSDLNVNVDSDSYEKIEDVHVIITHIIVYWFKFNQDSLI